MSMQLVLPQMSTPVEREGVACGEAAGDPASEETRCPRYGNEDTGSALLQAVLTRENLQAAFKRVRANKGAAGVDGLDIDQTSRHLVAAWPAIREELLAVWRVNQDETGATIKMRFYVAAAPRLSC